MKSQITVRLPEDLRHALDIASRKMQLKNSEIARRALREYLNAPDNKNQRNAERVRGLLGSIESGVADLAENSRAYILESLTDGR